MQKPWPELLETWFGLNFGEVKSPEPNLEMAEPRVNFGSHDWIRV